MPSRLAANADQPTWGRVARGRCTAQLPQPIPTATAGSTNATDPDRRRTGRARGSARLPARSVRACVLRLGGHRALEAVEELVEHPAGGVPVHLPELWWSRVRVRVHVRVYEDVDDIAAVALGRRVG
jgi:hypothetical protein